MERWVHTPTPYANPGPLFGGGVKCSCGADFKIGDYYVDTAKGKASKRKIKTMDHAWDQWRGHWGKMNG